MIHAHRTGTVDAEQADTRAAASSEKTSTTRLPVDTQLVAPLGEEGAAARGLKEQGFDGAFTFEGGHDVFFPLVTAARERAGLDLMTNIAVALPRSPVHLAHAAWDLQQLSGGRFRLGLGSQVRTHVTRRHGALFDPPVGRMREWVGATKAVLDCWASGEPLAYEGRFTSHSVMPPMFRPAPSPHPVPPVLMAALGPKMTAAAGEVADGLLVMPFNSARHVGERVLPALAGGLAAAGRPALGGEGDTFEVVAEVIVGCGRDERELAVAKTGVRGLLAFYASTPAYRSVLDVHGWGDLQPALRELTRAGRWAELPDAIDDTMLHTLAAVGSPKEVAAEIHARWRGVATRLAFYQPYASSPGTTGELLAAIRD
ncbi:TIGR03617 family F420-dependent LLM class oxidoreductase [Actinomadura xylanilytica]|uniref:TIGR03617 family F420-dependent LLM class oxidoreductase n=1 Tax=Actinomadura xylanilytica TaxID=887459 RepID=UPI00255B0011|nr:TIGR03617 family F420-dependent LLM class oxidoreductase [Actinomadura xylanilytica]MDL4772993.1 TIGR03617 family F420-dependent LLM class oxidoreductase [Actinomadura xylanilytica]